MYTIKSAAMLNVAVRCVWFARVCERECCIAQTRGACVPAHYVLHNQIESCLGFQTPKTGQNDRKIAPKQVYKT
jgi:hypothetical protein